MGSNYAVSVVGKQKNVIEFDVIGLSHDHEGTPHPNPANPSFFFFLIADETGPGKPALVKALSAHDRYDEAWVAEHAGEYIANVEVLTTSGYPGMRADMPLVKYRVELTHARWGAHLALRDAWDTAAYDIYTPPPRAWSPHRLHEFAKGKYTKEARADLMGLCKLLTTNDGLVLDWIIEGLGRLGDPRAASVLVAQLGTVKLDRQQLAVIAVGRLGKPARAAKDALRLLASSPDAILRGFVGFALKRCCGDVSGLDALREILTPHIIKSRGLADLPGLLPGWNPRIIPTFKGLGKGRPKTLRDAIIKRDPESIRALVGQGANITPPLWETGDEPPLAQALRRAEDADVGPMLELADLLVELGAQIDGCRGYLGPLLYLAADDGRNEAAHWLVDHGAKLEDGKYHTLLERAEEQKMQWLVKLCLAEQAKPKPKTKAAKKRT